MKVLGWGREASLAAARAAGDTVPASKEEFLEQSDVVSIHVRLIEATRGMVTAADLARMKPGALFVNTSRAGLVAPGALESALKAGRPGMAAVDVFEEEPIPPGGHPLLKLDNVLALPHLGYVERDGLQHQFSTIFDQILAYAAGTPINVHNPEVLTKK
jgi:D-3-phosphoglycerate dehydrogenase